MRSPEIPEAANVLMAPLKRNVTQEEVGSAALYLLSDLASGVTGQVQYVDCGFNIIGMHVDDEAVAPTA